MTGLLANLCTVPGVLGAALFDDDGECLEHRLTPEQSPELAGRVLTDLLAGLDAYEYLDRDPFRFGLARFPRGVLAVLRTPKYRAIAFAATDISPSLLTVALGALESKLARLAGPDASTSATAAPGASGRFPVVNAGDDGASDFAPDAAVQSVLDALAECLGPVARVLVRDQLDALGVNGTHIHKATWPAFIENLAHEIPADIDRRTFITRVRALA